MQKLHQHGITLLNQSVLLAGVNDSAEILVNLSQKLFENSVMPYYLHQLDKVKGAAHFYVDKAKACQIMEEILLRLPGYLVPRLVEEIAGEKSKITIM
jgi:L-lysine 2,3-aminomutase